MGKLFEKSSINIEIDEDDYLELQRRCFSVWGYPSVDTSELSNEDFYYIIKSAMQNLNTWVPMIEYISLPVQSNVSDYTVDKVENISSVLDMYVSKSTLLLLGMPVQNLMLAPVSLVCSRDISNLPDYVSLISAYNTSKNFFQVEPRAELIGKNKVRILPQPWSDDTYLLKVTMNHENNLGSFSHWETDWLIRYCTNAVGKQIATIRSKYTGVDLPVGNLSTSAGEMRTECLEKEKALMEELMNYRKYSEVFLAVG